MIVLIGGSGRVGSAVVAAILAHRGINRARSAPPAGDQELAPDGEIAATPSLRVVTRRPEELSFERGVEVVEGNLDDRQSIERAVEGAQRLFLLSTAHPYMERREMGAVEAARKAGVHYALKVSGSNGLVGPGSRSLTMRQHHEIEQMLKESGLAWAILRPSAFIQTTMEQIAPFVRDSRRFSLPGAGRRYAFIDTRDIGAVAAEILTGESWWNATHVLTGPEALSYSRIAQIISDAVGTEVAYRRQPLFLARLAINQQVHYHHARDQAADLAAILQRGADDLPTDTVERILGRPPQSVDRWIADNVSLFRSR